MKNNNFCIAIHGGVSTEFSEFSKNNYDKYIQSVDRIIKIGYKILENGGSALDAVEAVVIELENDPLYNAGTGCCLTSEGTIELDSMIMDGKDQKVGAVAGVNFYKNPVKLARMVMDKSKHCMICGEGLKKFALSQGVTLLEDIKELVTERELKEFEEYKRKLNEAHKCGDTVGAIALDQFGNMACGTSTGGICGKLPGRIGDVPLVGCGGFADKYGATSATGHGESIMRFTCCRDIVAEIKAGISPQEATKNIIDIIHNNTKGTVGVISLNKDGDFGVYHNGGFMPWAFANSQGVTIFKNDL